MCPKKKNIVKSEQIYCSMIFSDPIMIYMSVFSTLGSLAYLGATLSQSVENTFQAQFIVLVSYPLPLSFLHVILGMTMISARHNTDHVP